MAGSAISMPYRLLQVHTVVQRTDCEAVELLYHETLILGPRHVEARRAQETWDTLIGEIMSERRHLVKRTTEWP
jgi:hypothetical protein